MQEKTINKKSRFLASSENLRIKLLLRSLLFWSYFPFSIFPTSIPSTSNKTVFTS